VVLGIGCCAVLAIGLLSKDAFDEQWIRHPVQITYWLMVGILMIGGGEICRARKCAGLEISLALWGLGALYPAVYARQTDLRLMPDGPHHIRG